jgi:hypothetical protein
MWHRRSLALTPLGQRSTSQTDCETIGFRDSVHKDQEALGLDKQEFANFKLCSKHGLPRSSTNRNHSYTLVRCIAKCRPIPILFGVRSASNGQRFPPPRSRTHLAGLRERCRSFFGDSHNTVKVNSAMEGRLYQIRRNWQQR